MVLDVLAISNTIQQKVPDGLAYPDTGKTVRVDISTNNVQLRKQVTGTVMSLFEGSTTKTERPFDILLPDGFKVLVKPAKGARKTGSSADYGLLAKIDLTNFDTSAFSGISAEFARGELVSSIKEASDVKCVSDLNNLISGSLKNDLSGMTISIAGFKFQNIIGCVPVTNGEPKADVVLVSRKNKVLTPTCFLSYKMGRSAKDFQNYSGLSNKSSPYIFNHPETFEFFKKLSTLSSHGKTDDLHQPIKDNKIIGKSVWGMDYPSSSFGINNCHFIAQGEPSLSGSSLKYNYVHENGDFTFDKTYQPVFGARYTSNRNNIGPKGLTAKNFRIGIYPRAYRPAWLK